jgi:hypothetical protein
MALTPFGVLAADEYLPAIIAKARDLALKAVTPSLLMTPHAGLSDARRNPHTNVSDIILAQKVSVKRARGAAAWIGVECDASPDLGYW